MFTTTRYRLGKDTQRDQEDEGSGSDTWGKEMHPVPTQKWDMPSTFKSSRDTSISRTLLNASAVFFTKFYS